MTTQTPGLPQLPEEARADAVSELERYDDALAGDPLTGDPFSPIVAPDDDLQRDIREGSGDPRALEDLYAEHPDIGGGSKFLRVVRKAPRNWAGMNIAGFVTDLHEQLGMEAFAARFGGGDYVVAVMGAGGGTLEPDGSQRVRTIQSMRLGLSGPPKLLSGQGTAPITGRVGMNENAQVEMAKLQIAERERERALQAQREASAALARSKSVGPDVIKNLDEIASSRALQMQGAYTQQITQQLRTIERLEIQRNRLEDEIQEERRKAAEAERKWTTYGMQAEQEVEKRLKDNHEAALKRVTEDADKRVKEAGEDRTRRIEELQRDHGKRLEDLAKEHSSRMDQLRTSHEKEIKDLNERNTEERKRLETHAQDEKKQIRESAEQEKKQIREDADRREKQVANDTMVRENNATQQAEARLHDTERLHGRELQGLKDAHAREVMSIQVSADSKVTTATSTAEMKVSLAEQERSRTKSELDQLRRENAELRSKAHKEPMQAISEAHALAEMTGMIRSPDLEGKETEGEFDWKKGLFTFLNGAIAKLPEAMKSMEEARQANQAAAKMAQGAPGQQMQHVQGPDGRYYVVQPPPQAAQGPVRRVRRAPPMPGFGSMPPEWGHGAGPVEPGANPYVPPVGPPTPVSAGVPPPFPFGSQAPSRTGVAPPVSGREPGTSRGFTPFEGPPAEPPVAAYAPAVEAGPGEAPSPMPPPQAGPGAPAVAVTFQQVQQFADNLEMAVQTGAVSPEQFAQQFVGQVGPEGTRVILSSMTPDQLVDQIAQSKDGASTALATQDGRTYLRELWAAAGRLVGMSGRA